MTAPASTKHGATFDLASSERELRQEDAYQRDGHTARTFIRESDLRIVHIVMKAGSRMPTHKARETASIHVLRGQVRLRLPDRTVDVSEGCLLALAPDLEHDVEAVVDSALLLTLGWDEKNS